MSWKDDVWGVGELDRHKYKCSGCKTEGEILVPKDKNIEIDFKGRLRLAKCLKCAPEIMYEKGYRPVE